MCLAGPLVHPAGVLKVSLAVKLSSSVFRGDGAAGGSKLKSLNLGLRLGPNQKD